MKFLLNAYWQFKRRNPTVDLNADWDDNFEKWHPATVPGSIHQDLLAAGLIADPFFGLNEKEVQWVGETDWLYRCRFDRPSDIEASGQAMLCFDGLDTVATVWLNGEQILVSDNMFVLHRLEVSALIKSGENELRVLFESAARKAREREAEYGVLPSWGYWTATRLYLRKAQYHFGWDWGPALVTAGLWRPVWLESYSVRIAELNCQPQISADLKKAALPVQIKIENAGNLAGATLKLALFGPSGEILEETGFDLESFNSHSNISHTMELLQPQLWWPCGYGKQPLYRLEASLHHNEVEIHRQEQRLGMRRLRLLQEPVEGEPGASFLFEINNTPLFCSGANWIPADSFTPRITPERYRQLIELAAAANVVMLRVWGGGIYEEDVFYDLCDELGLLVWQDFMFACGIYPPLEWFKRSVQLEAEYAVRRLRHHVCLALWCGNNEDYQVAFANQLYEGSSGDGAPQAARSFPAQHLYEQLLAEVCHRLDPQRPYWPGSPFGGADPNDPTTGDRHTWDVWHGAMDDYHHYSKYEGRFVSEFGMQALPDMATINTFTAPQDRYPLGRVLEHHNKAPDGSRRLAVYLSDNLPLPRNLESYIYSTQFVQAEALASAVGAWRKRWKGPGQYAVSGALVWQLNDCWPVTSWSLIDFEMRPKPAYYVLRREFEPLTLSLAATQDGKAALWVVNGGSVRAEVTLVLRSWNLQGEMKTEQRQTINLSSHGVTELETTDLEPGENLVLSAQLLETDIIVARTSLWPEPFKYLNLPDPKIEIIRLANEKMLVRSARPAKGVWLTAGTAKVEVKWSDNMFDLLPNEERLISASGLGEAEVTVQSLYNLFPSKPISG